MVSEGVEQRFRLRLVRRRGKGGRRADGKRHGRARGESRQGFAAGEFQQGELRWADGSRLPLKVNGRRLTKQPASGQGNSTRCKRRPSKRRKGAPALPTSKSSTATGAMCSLNASSRPRCWPPFAL